MAAASPTLPSNLYSEILTRSSFYTVGRCRLLSKQINRLTYESCFINQLCHRTNTTHGVFIQSYLGRNKHISTFVQAVDDNNYNDDISDSKQLSLSFRCEVYDSKARAWRQLSNVALPIDAFLSTKPTVSAYGALHWLLGSCLDHRARIFAFHVKEENREIFAQPCSAVENVNMNKVVEYQGCLAWVCEGNDLIELWVMEDYKNRVWSKEKTIRIKRVDHHLASFATLCNNDVAVMRGCYKIIFYKFGDYCGSKIVTLEDISKPDEIFMLQSDSEPTKLKGPLKSWLIVRWFRSVRKKWSPGTKHHLKIARRFCHRYGSYALQFIRGLKI